MAGERSFSLMVTINYTILVISLNYLICFWDWGRKGYMDELSMGPLTNGMKVVVNKGCAVICGRGYIIDGVKIFTHDPAHTTLDRIDRIILQLNLATRSINLMIKRCYSRCSSATSFTAR